MADAENQNFWRKIQEAVTSAFNAEGDKSLTDKLRDTWSNLTTGQDSAADAAKDAATRARDNLRQVYDKATDNPRGQKVREKIDHVRDKARDSYNNVMDSDQGKNAREKATSVLQNFREMNPGNKTTAAIGGGMMLEGAFSAANNARHGRGKRLCLAIGRAAIGAVVVYGSKEASKNGQNLFEYAMDVGKSFVDRENARRSGGARSTGGPSV